MKTYPLSQSQLGVYLEHIQHPESMQYNLPRYFHFSKNTDAEKLKRAIMSVMETYPVFYTRVITQNGELRQYPDYDLKIDIPVIQVAEEDVEQRISQFIRPFDFQKDVLSRFLLIETPESLYLACDIHHIILDGSSDQLLIRYIGLAYNGQSLPKEQISLHEYAEQEELTFQTYSYEQAATHYREKFDNVAMTKLSQKNNNEGYVIRRSAFVSKQLINDFCVKEGIKPSWMFMAALGIVLSKFSREETIAYTTINHGRHDKSLLESFGMFVKTVPILTKIDKRQSVIDFIKSHKEKLASTRSYGVYPFTHLCQQLGIKPELTFGFQGSHVKEDFCFLGENIKMKQLLGSGLSIQNPSVVIYETNTEYDIRLKYVESQYEGGYMQQFADAMATCVEQLLASPDKLLKDISIVSEKEQQELITLGKGEELAYDRTETFVDLFRKQVAIYPDSTAVVDELSSITYAELDRQSDLLAHTLTKSGVKTNTFVAVMLPRCKEFVIGVLAVLKAGGAYIPLDDEYPNERLLYMLKDSAAKILITTRTLLEEKHKEGDFRIDNILFIDEFDFSGSSVSINNSCPESLAYMIYTSGSTGKPKGVMLEHRGLVNFTHSLIVAESLTNKDRTGCHRSFSFDAHIDDLYPILAVGGEMHIMPSDIRKDLQMIYDFIVKHQITGTGFTTSLMMMLLNKFDLPLRFITAGGEKLYGVSSDKIRIINLYGPTECTNDSTLFIINPGEKYENIPIGRPLHNMSCFVIDIYGQLVARGVAGELCVAGVQVGRAYLNRPELSAEKFVPCPFIENERMYHTGDLVRWNENGDLEYLGRIDTQVKLRGFRIEMGEIESAISKYEGIENAVVEVKEIGNIQHLCAYYTCEQVIDEEDMRCKLRETLTDYMIPTVFMRMDSIPRTPSGKIDRKVLPVPTLSSMIKNVPPCHEVEEKMLEIARELLPGIEFGVTDDLFSLGMTSLQAMQYSSRIKPLHLDIRVSALMRDRSIRAILNGNIRLFWFHDKYDKSKPTLVYVSGIVPIRSSLEKFDLWSEDFNIFIIEPLDSHYQKLFKGADFEEVVWMYSTFIEQNMPEDAYVFGFMGLSWGGKVAYYLAQRWNEVKGQLSAVIMGDSRFNNPIVEIDKAGLRVAMEAYKDVSMAEVLIYMIDCIYHVESVNEMPKPKPYSGHVLYFNTIKDGLTPIMQENLSILRELATDLDIVDIPNCNHDEIVTDQSLNTLFREYLWNIINK